MFISVHLFIGGEKPLQKLEPRVSQPLAINVENVEQ
jgi:hypothetical protein